MKLLKRESYPLAAGLSILLMGLLWFILSRPSARLSSTTSDQTEASNGESGKAAQLSSKDESARRQIVGMVESMLNTPIVFYGKVVDQNGDPVPNADVRYSLLDSFNESGSGGGATADSAGWIEIKGVKGAILGVNVSRSGYHQIHNVSNQRFAYGYGTDAYTKPAPTKENPAVLILHKMGVTEPLVFTSRRTVSIPKDGRPVRIDLRSGEVTNTGQIVIEAITSDGAPENPKRYDWKCRLSVPGGGLIEREGQFQFEAPMDGYREYDEIIKMKEDPGWERRFQKEYFLRLSDQTYARIDFSFTSAGEHFATIESHLNPKSGSRNLEFNPTYQP